MEVDLLALDRQVCFALAAASRSVISLYRPALEPLGLTHPQYLVMLALWERNPRPLRDLAETLLLDSPTLSPILKRLEVAGLVSRKRNVHDDRVLDITLTEAGVAMREKAEVVPVHVAESLGLTPNRLRAIRDDLNELLEAAKLANDRH